MRPILEKFKILPFPETFGTDAQHKYQERLFKRGTHGVAGPKGNYIGRTTYPDAKTKGIIQIVSNKLLSEEYPLTFVLEQKLKALNMPYMEYLQRIRAAVVNHEVRHLCKGQFRNVMPVNLFNAIEILDYNQIKSDSVLIDGAVINADGKTDETIEEWYATMGLLDDTLDPSVKVIGWEDANINQFKPELELVMWVDFNNNVVKAVEDAHDKGDIGKMKASVQEAAYNLMKGAMQNDPTQKKENIDAAARKFAKEMADALFKSFMYPDHSGKFGKIMQNTGLAIR